MKISGLPIALLLLIPAVTAIEIFQGVPDRFELFPNQTSSDAAANMTRTLYGESSLITCPSISLANVKITPTLCLFEVTARCPSMVGGTVAPLYAKYLKLHPDYIGILAVNVYAQDKTLVMTTTVSNEDARANYEGISYLMEKNADYLQYPAKRTDGLETPLGIGW